MNVIALILALIGAGLSMFQPVIPYMNISVSDLLSSGNSDLSSIGAVVLLIAVAAVICGAGAVLRKDKTFCAGGLALCGGVLLLSAAMFSENPSQMRNLPFSFRGMAMSIWMETVFIWALCYIGAAVCAYIDNSSEADTSSAQANSTTTAQPQTKQPESFEPVTTLVGIKTSALLRRANIFLLDDDFDKAAHYFEQALRQDPENSQAYIGKLMAEQKVHNLDELSCIYSPLNEQNLFRHALEFAGEEELPALQKCLNANNQHIEALRVERHNHEQAAIEREYQRACYIMKDAEDELDVDAMDRARKIFSKLGSYKDSKALAEKAGQFIDKEFRAGNTGSILL